MPEFFDLPPEAFDSNVSKFADSEADSLILLIEDSVVVFEEIQTKDPEADGGVGHDTKLDYVL